MKRTLAILATVAVIGGAQGVPPQAGPYPPVYQQPGYQPPNQPPYQGAPGRGMPGQGGPGTSAPNIDDSEHGVARISVMQGEVSVRHGDAGDLSAAVMNAPLVATDRVATGANSRAEVQFDGSNMIRLSSSSEVRLGDLQYKRYLIQIAQGITSFHVVRPNDSQVEISTPTVSVRPLGAGTYRVAVNPDGTSEITVRSGEAEVFSPKGSERVGAGQTMMARGDPSDPEFQVNGAAPLDEWDRWNSQRDSEVARYSNSRRYVNQDIYGTEDLDQNGRWVNDPAYGQVWVPTVGPDWAPYRAGQWVWEDYYGWVWLSADPWGWAPYHWGRWYMGPYGWAWWPGAFGARAYWSPALVGFFGWGGGVGIGVGFGFGFGFANIGWVPLAPFEPFRPWYGRGIGGVNVVNNFNVVNGFRNARFVNGVNGVTGMRANEFGRAAVSTASFARASAADLRGAGAIQGRMPVAPGVQAGRFSNRAINTAGMPASRANQRFAGRSSFGPSTAGRTAGNSAGAANGEWQRMTPRGGSTSTAGGGWHSINPGSSAGRSSAGADPRASGYNRGGSSYPAARSGGGTSGYSTPQGRGYGSQQPVRISPPIVSNRGASSGGAAQRDVHSGFGGAHSGTSAPRGSSGGGHRGR